MEQRADFPNWDDFKVFLALYRGKTLRSAARALGVDQATAGRRIRALEEACGARLFERREQGYHLTAAGARVLEGVDRIEKEFDEVGRRIAGRDERLEGVIRIAAPGAVANHLLIPRLKDFMCKHPRITLEFLTGPEVVNLAKREADVALRLVRPVQKDIQLKNIGTLELGLYASHELLKRLGLPESGDQLERFPFAGLTPEAISEMEARMLRPFEGHLSYVLRTHAWSSVFSAVSSGAAIGVIPTFMAEGSTERLRRIDLGGRAASPLWLAYHSDLKTTARVKALTAAIERCVRG